MIARSDAIRKAEKQFQDMIAFVEEASVSRKRVDQVERSLFGMALQLCYYLLVAFTKLAGNGDEGKQVEREGTLLKRSQELVKKTYRSIFGVLHVSRYVYARGPKKKAEWIPVDARLGMPAGEQSYVLEDWCERLCVKESFGEGVGSLRDLLGVKTSVRSAERMNRELGEYAEEFAYECQPVPEEEGDILVLTADGKGVPVRRPLEQRIRQEQGAGASEDTGQTSSRKNSKRRKRGEKRVRKQMAIVGAVYSIDRFRRTPDDVLDELRRTRRRVERPRPQHKQVFAELTEVRGQEVTSGLSKAFRRLAWAAINRLSDEQPPLVCLLDGQQSLWSQKEAWFGRAVGILDIYHVSERLWTVAHCIHPEGSLAAENFVDRKLRMLLEGKVGYVIGDLRRLIGKHKLKGGKRKTVEETITYYDNNRAYMKYDEYLAQGFPIGTGVAEGACRHLVKDRMERTGMRWEIEGAQPMLSNRAIYLNDQWDEFIEYRIQTEQRSLYAQAA